MPEPLPFEYRPKWRDIPVETPADFRRVMEQRDRELEDFLATLGTGTGVAPLGVAVRYGGGDALFGTGFNSVYWNLLLHSTDGYADYVAVEGGETNNRIHFYTAGIYEVDWEVYSNDVGSAGMPGTIETNITLTDTLAHDLVQGQGRAISHDSESGDADDTGVSIATGSHTLAAGVDDYMTLNVRSTGGTGVSYEAHVSLHYIGPIGYRLPFSEG